jgi:hypothetical protein
MTKGQALVDFERGTALKKIVILTVIGLGIIGFALWNAHSDYTNSTQVAVTCNGVENARKLEPGDTCGLNVSYGSSKDYIGADYEGSKSASISHARNGAWIEGITWSAFGALFLALAIYYAKERRKEAHSKLR